MSVSVQCQRGACNTGTNFSLCAAVVWIATGLSGCWTPPRIPDRPPGAPGVIASNLAAATTRADLVVRAVDPARHVITLLDPQERVASTYGIDSRIKNISAIHVGEHVKATVTAQLTVYVRDTGESGQAGSASPGAASGTEGGARVASVDVSYRLLTVQLRGGLRETFKLPLGVRLNAIRSGDDVAIRPDEVLALAVHKPLLDLRLLGPGNE